MHNLSRSRSRSQPLMIRSTASIAKRKSNSVEHRKRYRHACSESTGPAADARRERQREQNRQRQARHCERVRQIRAPSCAPVEQGDYEMGNGGGPSVLQQPEGGLPQHQLEAIDDFFNRLAHSRSDVHECTTCLEKYFGMHVRGSQCDRCSHEVRFLLFLAPFRRCAPFSHRLTARGPPLQRRERR